MLRSGGTPPLTLIIEWGGRCGSGINSGRRRGSRNKGKGAGKAWAAGSAHQGVLTPQQPVLLPLSRRRGSKAAGKEWAAGSAHRRESKGAGKAWAAGSAPWPVWQKGSNKGAQKGENFKGSKKGAQKGEKGSKKVKPIGAP